MNRSYLFAIIVALIFASVLITRNSDSEASSSSPIGASSMRHASGGGARVVKSRPAGGGHAPVQAARISQNISRTPSLSRSLIRPTPHAVWQPSFRQTRPSSSPAQLRQFIQQNPQFTSPSRSRDQVKQFIQQSKQIRAANPAAIQNPQSIKAPLPNQIRTNTQIANRVRAQVRQNHPQFNQWFSNSFFEAHHWHPFFHNRGANWWGTPTWVGVCNWLPWGWGTPVYYDDSGYPVSLPSDVTTYPPETYYQEYPQNEEYVQPLPSAPETTPPPLSSGTIQPAEEDWLPLGIFAAGENSTTVPYSNMFVQLALSKTGDISGTYYNSATDETHPLEGAVDKESQEAAWKVSDDPNSPLMTTGIYNLTQDMATVQVHFPDGTIQPWTLVRLNK